MSRRLSEAVPPPTIYILTSNTTRVLTSLLLNPTCYYLSTAIQVGMKWDLMVLSCVPSMASDVELCHVLTDHICITFGKKTFQIICPFLHWVICLFIIKMLKSASHILDMLLPMHVLQVSSPTVWVVFSFSQRCPIKLSCLILKKLNLSGFLWLLCFRHPIWKLLINPRSKNAHPCVLQRASFQLTFRSSIHFWVHFCLGKRELLHSLHVDFHLSHNHLWKDCSLSPIDYLVQLAFVYWIL